MSPPVGVLARKIWSGRITKRATAAAPMSTTQPTSLNSRRRPVVAVMAVTEPAGYRERRVLGTSRLLEDRGQIEDLAVGVPPAVLTPVTGVEEDVGAIRERQLDLDGIGGAAAGARDIGSPPGCPRHDLPPEK
jgi:hypothetical protein